MSKMDSPRQSRRSFLAAGAGVAASVLARPAAAGAGNPANQPPNVPEWTKSLGEGVAVRPYGKPSKFEKDVVRRDVEWLTASRESSVSFTPLHELEGIITPNGLCFERHHGGIAEVDPADHRLMIHGLVERPLILTLEELKRYPRVNRIHFMECAANSGMEWRGAQLNGCQFTHGMIHCVQYTGVSLRTLLEEAGVKTNGKWLLVEGADAAAMDRSLPIEKALDDCIIAYKMNGEALYPEQGYPMRLVVPGWIGNLNVKWVRRIKVTETPTYTKDETSRYTELMPDGRARQFQYVQEVKSLITQPSRGLTLPGAGRYEVSGLAWSGEGRIARVEVSADGGRSWADAALQEPVLAKCFTRFRIPWEWDGAPATVQSRATDEKGNVQPTRDAWLAQYAPGQPYHYNAIQIWRIQPGGEVMNAYA